MEVAIIWITIARKGRGASCLTSQRWLKADLATLVPWTSIKREVSRSTPITLHHWHQGQWCTPPPRARIWIPEPSLPRLRNRTSVLARWSFIQICYNQSAMFSKTLARISRAESSRPPITRYSSVLSACWWQRSPNPKINWARRRK